MKLTLGADQADSLADRELHAPTSEVNRWFARDVGGVWSVVRVSLPHDHAGDALRPTVEAKLRPPHPDDPRPNTWRDLGGPNIGPV